MLHTYFIVMFSYLFSLHDVAQIVESVLCLFAFYMVEKSSLDLFSWEKKVQKWARLKMSRV